MKSINNFILEKLKVSSKRNLPSIDDFCNRFLQYIHKNAKTSIRFLDLDVFNSFDIDKPETFDILPTYEFTGHEKFLNMQSNRFVHIPEGIIYLISIDMFLEKDYYFSLHYILEGGLYSMDFQHPYYFDVSKEDLLEVIGEDTYLELYDYLEQYEKD